MRLLTGLNFKKDNLKWVFDGKKIQSKELEKLVPDIQMLLSKQALQCLKGKKMHWSRRFLKKYL